VLFFFLKAGPDLIASGLSYSQNPACAADRYGKGQKKRQPPQEHFPAWHPPHTTFQGPQRRADKATIKAWFIVV
jgi:hypothetical protein